MATPYPPRGLIAQENDALPRAGLAIVNEGGSLTQLPGIGVWRWFPGRDRINLRRALVIDDMICRI